MKAFTAKILGSLAFKIICLVTVIGLTTAVTVYLGLKAFVRTSQSVAELVERQVPVLKESNSLLSGLSEVNKGFSEVLAANDEASLTAIEAALTATLSALRAGIDGTDVPDLSLMVSGIETQLAEVIAARADEFARQNSIDETLIEMQQRAIVIAEVVAAESDSAYFDLVLGGEQTVSAVSRTLDKLISQDVGDLQSAMAARVEVNVLIGVTLGLIARPGEARTAILVDLARGSLNRLGSVAEDLSVREDTAEKARGLLALQTRGAAIVDRPQSAIISGQELVTSLKEVDAALAIWQDNLGFELELAAIEAGETNKADIERMIETHVEPLRQFASLDSAARSVFAGAIAVALATSPSDADTAQQALVGQANGLARALSGIDDSLRPDIERLISIADPATGIHAEQIALLEARANAAEASREAAVAVGRLSDSLRASAAETLGSVAVAGNEILALTKESTQQMWVLTALTGGLIAVSPFVAWLLIIRPIRRATNATVRLSQGDLEAVDRLRAGEGEVGQLSGALLVFRDNLREKIALEEEERQNAEERAAQALAAERTARERDMREAEERADRERRERERHDAEEAERNRLREVADLERQEMLEGQNRIVTALAKALSDVSEGDLSVQITEPFPGDSDSLRQDFNEAMAKLCSLLTDVQETAQTIEAETSSVANASTELARRTESTAATLEQSSAALTELTKLVQSTAGQSGQAREVADDAQHKSSEGRDAVREAKTAMDAIAQSSEEISKIVELISGIAFQTNLLALNAGVEAARAGESGRGFAVVASEVRALSLRTTDAAQEISQLISQSAEEVQRGVTTVAEADTSLEKISVSIVQLNKAIAEISAATGEQSSGLAEIDSAVSQLDHNTQSNAAIAEEVTASGHSLVTQVGQLRGKLKQFRMEANAISIDVDQNTELALARSA